MAKRSREGIKPIIFHYTPDDNDVNLSLDEIIAKKGIKRVPKCYEDKKSLIDIATEIKNSMVNDPDRDVPKGDENEENEDILDNEVLDEDETVELDEDDLVLDEDTESNTQPKAKRIKMVYDDVEPIPDEEDEDVKNIHFGPPSPPSRKTPNLDSLQLTAKRLIKNVDDSVEEEDEFEGELTIADFEDDDVDNPFDA